MRTTIYVMVGRGHICFLFCFSFCHLLVIPKEEKSKVGENKLLKDNQKAKHGWVIQDFPRLNVSKFDTGIFEVNGCRWRLLIFPKGNGVDYLSVYLDVPDPDTLSDGWSRIAKYSIDLVNKMDSKKTVKREAVYEFKAGKSSNGFTSFFPLSKLLDKKEGYLVNGECKIDVEIHVLHTTPVSPDKRLDSSVPVDPSLSSSVDLDNAESIYNKAKSFLMLTSKELTSSVSDATCAVPLIEDSASLAKERFNELISFPLDNLVDPKHETAMIECLHIVVDHLSLFSGEQAKEIMRLKALFPTIIQDWRDSVQVKVSCQSLLSTSEKTQNLLKGSVKTEEGIKSKLEELKIREKELKAQLEVLQNESERLEKERLEVSKQTQQIYALAEEQADKIIGKEMEMAGAENKLEDLKSKWASVKSVSFKHEIFGSQHLYFGGRQFICCFLVFFTAFVCYLIILCN